MNMNIMEHIKHAPKWTWYSVAGVSAGVIALKLYNGRSAPDPTATATDASTAGDTYSDSTQPATMGGSPAGIIVPPTVVAGDSQSASDIGAAFAGLVGGTIDDLTGLVGSVVSGDQANMNQLITGQQGQNESVIEALANAGSAPKPAVVNPAPVTVKVVAPSAPPRQNSIKNPGGALAAINAALASSGNKTVENNLRIATAHINSGHPELARGSLIAARALATGGATKGHINDALNNI